MAPSQFGNSALMMAAFNGFGRGLTLLLDRGADINGRNTVRFPDHWYGGHGGLPRTLRGVTNAATRCKSPAGGRGVGAAEGNASAI